MFEDLQIILYPDPRLRKISAPIDSFDDRLSALIERMFALMAEHKGVGLAAPQVGINQRLFIMNPTGEPEDARVYVNPRLADGTGEEEDEEGCLSLPKINTRIARSLTLRMEAQDRRGNPIVETDSGYRARIWQHEMDHLNGVMIIDRMGPTAKMAAKKTLRELEQTYLKTHPLLKSASTAASKSRKRR